MLCRWKTRFFPQELTLWILCLHSHGTDKVAFCSTNVTEWSSICNLFAHTYKTFGPRIDFVVRCASRRLPPFKGC